MDITRKELDEIICDIFEIKKVTSLMNTHISKFIIERGYTYREIAQALVYFVEIEKGNVDVKYGLGIIPHVVERSNVYFNKLRKQKEEQIKSLEENQKKEINILFKKQIKPRRKINQIDIDNIDIN